MPINLTLYTDSLSADVGGCANGPIVRIRTQYRDDSGIHAHEYLHVEQFWSVSLAAVMLIGDICHAAGWPLVWCGLGLSAHSLLYRFVHDYRLWAEASAYREQLKHYPDDRSQLFAEFIATRYKLKISAEQALDELKK
jgi:hypothetical protein